MYDDRKFLPLFIRQTLLVASDSSSLGSHPLLAQVPLTVSPFVSLPTATTLPYTYKSLPSTLPPSSTDPNYSTLGTSTARTDNGKPKFIISSNGIASHPDDIIASCRAVEARLTQLQEDADRTLTQWRESIEERELAEKRRLAPGWLDRDEKILQPARTKPLLVQDLMTGDHDESRDTPTTGVMTTANTEGEELDRAFGGMRVT